MYWLIIFKRNGQYLYRVAYNCWPVLSEGEQQIEVFYADSEEEVREAALEYAKEEDYKIEEDK